MHYCTAGLGTLTWRDPCRFPESPSAPRKWTARYHIWNTSFISSALLIHHDGGVVIKMVLVITVVRLITMVRLVATMITWWGCPPFQNQGLQAVEEVQASRAVFSAPEHKSFQTFKTFLNTNDFKFSKLSNFPEHKSFQTFISIDFQQLICNFWQPAQSPFFCIFNGLSVLAWCWLWEENYWTVKLLLGGRIPLYIHKGVRNELGMCFLSDRVAQENKTDPHKLRK